MNKIEQKALELVNEVCWSDFKDLGSTYRNNLLDALCRAIERHEAFRQEVSDAVEVANMRVKEIKRNSSYIVNHMQQYIIAKPDPLAEALAECDGVTNFGPGYNDDARVLRAALAKRGLEIREKE